MGWKLPKVIYVMQPHFSHKRKTYTHLPLQTYSWTIWLYFKEYVPTTSPYVTHLSLVIKTSFA